MELNRRKIDRLHRIVRERRRYHFLRAILVGISAGLIAVIFQLGLFKAEEGRSLLLKALHLHPLWGWLVLPIVSGFIGAFVASTTARRAPEASGSGIPHIKGVLGSLRTLEWRRVLPVKFIGGILAIGSGFSLGREGPTVQMGAATGDIVGDALNLPDGGSRRHLIACGAGAGLAAAFNAPLSGFLFVIEELQREFSPTTYGTAFIAAVTAGAIARFATGQLPSFHAHTFPIPPLTALPLFAVLGIIAGFFGAAFNKSLIWITSRGQDIIKLTPAAKGAIAGVMVGLAAWWIPQAIGGGHSTAEAILSGVYLGKTVIWFLFALLAAKFVLTMVSYGAGVPGGIFAPILLMGATLGLLVGQLGGELSPIFTHTPAAFAVVGMGATFVAITRAPLTGIALILEMTASQEQLYALLVACLLAYLVAERLDIKPIYDALLENDLHRQGRALPDETGSQIMELMIEEGSRLAGRTLANANLPPDMLVVLIQRGGHELLPTGNTEIHIGDKVTAILSGGTSERIKEVESAARGVG